MPRTFALSLALALTILQSPGLAVDLSPLMKQADPCAHQAQHVLDDCCIGGFLDGRTLVVLPNRVMVALSPGQSFKGVRVVGTDNTSVTLDYKGAERRIDMGVAWQVSPQKDMSEWYRHYTKQCLRRICNERPYVQQKGKFLVATNGSVRSSDMMQVRRASPLGALPDYLESAEFVVLMDPPRPTRLKLRSFRVTEDCYRRLALSTANSMWCH